MSDQHVPPLPKRKRKKHKRKSEGTEQLASNIEAEDGGLQQPHKKLKGKAQVRGSS
jgi:hypothetical protein